ncbi:MAG: hypothetical protein AAF621_03235 [Pseudomonadota bacterium]
MSYSALKPAYLRDTLSPTALIDKDEDFSWPNDLSYAYKRVAELILQDTEFGSYWKLGGTTFLTQKIFNVSTPYFGPLHPKEVFIGCNDNISMNLIEYKAEAEIALKLSDNITISSEAIDNYTDTELFDQAALCLEMPSSPIHDIPKKGVATLVSDRCAAGALVIAPPISYKRYLAEPFIDQIFIRQDKQIISKGSIDNLVMKPELCVRSFLKIALENNITPKAGSWIATGGLTECIPLDLDKKVQLYYNNQCYLDFSIVGYSC